MRIQVKNSHIRSGLSFDGEKCPVALAMREALPQFPHLAVGKTTWREYSLWNAPKHELPDIVCQFIQQYDNNLVVQPFSFDIEEELFNENT